ncbi:MAG: helix-turn-helix domain-containing protein [Ruaniaceae bacterium]|nr:helix-turn-helix domain-containing protein [Ruaniaceae bacterium]
MPQRNGTPADPPDQTLVEDLTAATPALVSAAKDAMDAELPWYGDLSAHDRSWLGVVAQESITRFISWLVDPQPASTSASELFRVAPPELARSISLQNTVAVIRLLVKVVEEHAHEFVATGNVDQLRELALVYSREVAFSAAEVYARAAESRGAWDARQEALLIDSIVRGSTDDSLRSRASTLGWIGSGRTVVVVGTAPNRSTDHRKIDSVLVDLRSEMRRHTKDALVGLHGERIIAVIGGKDDPIAIARSLTSSFPEGPVVIGTLTESIADAGNSARRALAGIQAIVAWGSAPRPALAEDLLPERALNGDPLARATLVGDIYTPLVTAGTPLVDTLEEYLAEGRSLEGAARRLYVHPNTVRYRLRRISEVVGWDPTDAREGYVLQTALAIGRLTSP